MRRKRRPLTEKQAMVLAAIRSEIASGKTVGEAVREVRKSRMFNHMTVQRCADQLAKDHRLLENLQLESGTGRTID